MMKRIVSVIGLFAVLIASFVSISITDSKSIVSYKTYKEGNSNSQMARKILSDNILQEEKENMFNYASNGDILTDPYEMTTENHPEYVTNGLYSAEDEDGTSYYFRGNVNNNYVQFGEYTEDYYVYAYGSGYFQSLEACKEYNNSCSESNRFKFASKGDKMYWRIVRVNGDGSLRLIYNGTSVNPNYEDKMNSYLVGVSLYNINGEDPKYAGYTYDNGTDSFIKREVDTWYSNALGNTEYDSKVAKGRFCSDSSGYIEGSMLGNVFASVDRLGQVVNNFAKPNAPTLKCPSTAESYGGSYNLKAGLITADEMVFTGETFYTYSDSYLGLHIMSRFSTFRYDFWSMTPASYENRQLVAEAEQKVTSSVWNYYESIFMDRVMTNRGVRPVINLTKDTVIDGDGTSDNPYVVVEPNRYNGVITIEVNDNTDLLNAFDNINILEGVTWTSEDSSIAIVENGKIVGLRDGQTIIRGVSSDGLTIYEIKVTVLKNPVTMSSIYVIIGLGIIIGLGTVLYLYYRKKFSDL